MTTPTPTTVQVKIQLRRDTAATWASVNPVLLAGEAGLETDTNKIKIGNGSTAWNSLAYFPSIVTGGTVLGNLEIGSTGTLTFEGSTADGFETTLAVTNPTADRTITLPNQSGTVVVSGNASIVDADVSATAEIAVSKLADGAARQLLQTDAAGTGVEWTSNIDIPGTLDVTGAATFDAAVTITGDLTVNGTTTTINTQNLLVEDKNIIIGDVATPTDVTADGGGITLKGATDKTINWVDATDAWTSSERFSIPLGSAASPSLTFTGDANSGLYSPGADQVAISAGGTGRLFVDATGAVEVIRSNNASVECLTLTNQATSGAANASFQNFKTFTGSSVAYAAAIGATASTWSYGNSQPNSFIIQGYGSGGVGIRAANAPIIFSNGNADPHFSDERLRITSAGLVGIGTTSPAGKCVVRVSDNTGAPTAWNSNFLVVSNGDASTSSGIGFSVDTSDSSASISALTPGTVWLKQYYRANSHTFWYGDAGVTQGMTLDSSGRVGIATTSPGQALHVVGNVGVNTGTAPSVNGSGLAIYDALFPRLTFRNSTTGDGTGDGTQIVQDGLDLSVANTEAGSIRLFTANTERARIDSSGRLLVGTSSAFGANTLFESSSTTANAANVALVKRNSGTADQAGQQLHFYNFGPAGTARAVDTEVGSMRFYGSQPTSGAAQEMARITCAADLLQTGTNTSGRLVFSTTADGASSPTERMRINSAGSTGTLFGAAAAQFITSTVAAGTTEFLLIGKHSATTMYTGTDAFLVSTNGNVTNTNGSYTTISDAKLKENIVDAGSQWDDLKAIQIRNWNFKAETGHETHRQIGPIAQELETVCPGLVFETPDRDEDGNETGEVTKGVNQSVLYMKAVKALQEAMERIETLEQRLNDAGIS